MGWKFAQQSIRDPLLDHSGLHQPYITKSLQTVVTWLPPMLLVCSKFLIYLRPLTGMTDDWHIGRTITCIMHDVFSPISAPLEVTSARGSGYLLRQASYGN